MTQEQMNILVPQKLREMEKEYNMEVLLAVESGSRAWGFASPDSDFDVRFIYKRPRESYLHLDRQRDVIELPIDDTWDVSGWDLDVSDAEHQIFRTDELAKEAGLSRSSFQHIYRKLYGTGVIADLIRARTEYACYLLSSTTLPVYRIADTCGYHSEIHFMRQFKEQTGKTPTEYRRSCD